MLLYLRKKFTQYDHEYVYITKHRYVIRRKYSLCKTFVEYPTSFVEARLEELSNNISER